MLKELTAFLLALCVLVTVLGGCGSAEPEPAVPVDESTLRVFIDVEVGSSIINPTLKKTLEKYMETGDGFMSFQKTIKSLGGPELKLEFPPLSGDERDTYLINLRTEILAGKGPDVFICVAGPHYYTDYNHMVDGMLSGSLEEPLFTFPRQAIKRNMFLPLDSYIESFQFTDAQRLTPAVMEAGQYDGRQYLFPMSYTLPVTFFKKSDVQFDHSADLDWYDMLDGSPAVKASAVLDGTVYMGCALMPMAAEDKDELAFTEDELMDFVTRKAECRQEVLSGGELPAHHTAVMCVGFDEILEPEDFPRDEPLTMVPTYSKNGGCGAVVTSFAGVNANTEYPQAAAFLMDYLMSEDCQRSGLYAYVTNNSSVPVMEGLMQPGSSVDSGDGPWMMTEEDYQEFCALRDSITCVDFHSQLGREISSLYYDLQDDNQRKSAEALVHDAYMRMSMELAES